ncbi:MAG TPA: hypothetical protein VFS88_09425 [Micavibrio sp.]|nr:hypothetical protein [Micavibrio sp.]
MTKLGTFLCTGMMVWAAPALAGFEFTPASTAPSPQAERQVAADSGADAPMPILPAEPVAAEPLAAPGTDRVLATEVSRASDVEPVYVRRQRSELPPKIMKSQPMDAEALLTATAEKQPLVNSGKLTINPYPLEGSALHGGDGGQRSVEQAMMETSGTLRPVKTPGSNSDGLLARARPAAGQMKQTEKDYGDEVLIASNMTPFPGEEPKMDRIEAVPVPAMPRPAPLLVQDRVSPPANDSAPAGAVPRAPAQHGQFSEAVGFGRNLPLALALSQVVPPEYSYSFARNVNVGTTVSWQGGKPWNQVLADMLAQSGMTADIEDGQVTIRNAS